MNPIIRSFLDVYMIKSQAVVGSMQVIMIIKGNMRQVSFLHVYHHVSISLIWRVLCCFTVF